MNPTPDLTELRRFHVVAGAVLAVLLIGALDYITGTEASIAPLYLVPVALATWFVSLRAGLLLSGLSAVVRLQDLWLTTHHYVHPFTPYWNGFVELGFFIVVAYTLFRLRTMTEHWATLARTDLLTGAINREAFIEAGTLELARAERYGRWLTVAYLDIDDFKKVNDDSGHAYGDRILNEVARTLRKNLRAFDVVARYGGDEFVMLLPETGGRAAVLVLDKLMAALRSAAFGRWPATFSIGAVTIHGPRTTLDRLIQQADKLVGAAKDEGKNRVMHRCLHRGGTVDKESLPARGATILRPLFPSHSLTVLHAKGR